MYQLDLAKERKKSDLFVFSQWLKTLNLTLQKSKLFCVYVRGIKPAFLATAASFSLVILSLQLSSSNLCKYFYLFWWKAPILDYYFL